jgi:hypothetical protein
VTGGTRDLQPPGIDRTAGPLDDEMDEIAVVHWPAEARRRDELCRHGRARLLVVTDGDVPPPAPDPLEDWVRPGTDPVEVFVRKERLRRRQADRAPAVLDGDGLLRRGRAWVALSRRELEVATVLLDRAGTMVPRAELLARVRPGLEVDEHRVLDTVVRRLNARVAPLGLHVHAVRAAGFLLDMGELPSGSD